MPLYFHQGKPLFPIPGGWAVDPNCCCDDCSGIPAKLYVTIDGGDDCPGMTGFTFELNFDSGTGDWQSGPLSFCGGSATGVLVCLKSGLPVGSHLKDRMYFVFDFACSATPLGGRVPCTIASKKPFYAEFSPLDVGAAWAECALCCTGRETSLIFYITE